MDREPSRLRVVVDDRESTDVKTALERREGVVVTTHRLFAGDYLVNDRLIVERKTVSDLAPSITSGRIFSQAHAIAALKRPCLIVLEGASRDFRRIRLPRKCVRSALLSLTLSFGIPVLRATNPYETAEILVTAAQQMNRMAHALYRKRAVRPANRRLLQIRMLLGIPKLGPARALDLLDYFQSVGRIGAAASEELTNVPGIGPKLAARIHDAFHEEGVGLPSLRLSS